MKTIAIRRPRRPAQKIHAIHMTGVNVHKVARELKTETRRVTDPQPPAVEEVRAACGETYEWIPPGEEAGGFFDYWRPLGPVEAVRRLMGQEPRLYCPYGLPGDLLYIKEDLWLPPMPKLMGANVVYHADIDTMEQIALNKAGWKRVRQRFMSKVYSRLLLEVTDIRLERLHEITENGAIAEGITTSIPDHGLYWCGAGALTDDRNPAFNRARAVLGFRGGFGIAWDTINGKKWPWRLNPWVWVVLFKLVEFRSKVPARTA